MFNQDSLWISSLCMWCVFVCMWCVFAANQKSQSYVLKSWSLFESL